MARKARKRVMHLGKRGAKFYISHGKKIYPGKKRTIKWGKTAKRR